jgi:mRNA interferase RelE/StbE
MRSLVLSSDALKFVRHLDAKQYRQVVNRVFSLMSDPVPADASLLKGYDGLWRVDIGEYRVIYEHDHTTLFVTLVGKRNDDDVDRVLSRKP